MKFTKVAVQQILRCKHCGGNPVIGVSKDMRPAWNGISLETYFVKLLCSHNGKSTTPLFESDSPSYAGMTKRAALSYAISVWNTCYGKK